MRSDPLAADGPDGAALAVAPRRREGALGEYSEPGEGPVEGDRIAGGEAGEPCRRLPGRGEVSGFSTRQAEITGDPVDVSVHREEEAGRAEAPACPEPQVQILGPDHPAKEQVLALAGGAAIG